MNVASGRGFVDVDGSNVSQSTSPGTWKTACNKPSPQDVKNASQSPPPRTLGLIGEPGVGNRTVLRHSLCGPVHTKSLDTGVHHDVSRVEFCRRFP